MLGYISYLLEATRKARVWPESERLNMRAARTHWPSTVPGQVPMNFFLSWRCRHSPNPDDHSSYPEPASAGGGSPSSASHLSRCEMLLPQSGISMTTAKPKRRGQ